MWRLGNLILLKTILPSCVVIKNCALLWSWLCCLFLCFQQFHSQMTNVSRISTLISANNTIQKLPAHLLIEIFIRVPMSEWVQLYCVNKQWTNLFREECLWNAALHRNFPFTCHAKRWHGPIPRGLSKRYISSDCLLSFPFLSLMFTCRSIAKWIGSLNLFMELLYDFYLNYVRRE